MKAITKQTRQTSSQLRLGNIESNEMIIDEYLKFKPETQAPNFDSTGPMNTPQQLRMEKKPIRQRRESSHNMLPPL